VTEVVSKNSLFLSKPNPSMSKSSPIRSLVLSVANGSYQSSGNGDTNDINTIIEQDSAAREELACGLVTEAADLCLSPESYVSILKLFLHGLWVQCNSDASGWGPDVEPTPNCVGLTQSVCHILIKSIISENQGRNLDCDFATNESISMLNDAAYVLFLDFDSPETKQNATTILMEVLLAIANERADGEYDYYYFSPAMALATYFLENNASLEQQSVAIWREHLTKLLKARLLSTEGGDGTVLTASAFEVQLCSPLLCVLTQAEFETSIARQLKLKLMFDPEPAMITTVALVQVLIESNGAAVRRVDLFNHFENGINLVPAGIRQLCSSNPESRLLGSDLLVYLLIGSASSRSAAVIYSSAKVLAHHLINSLEGQGVVLSHMDHYEAVYITLDKIGQTLLNLIVGLGDENDTSDEDDEKELSLFVIKSIEENVGAGVVDDSGEAKCAAESAMDSWELVYKRNGDVQVEAMESSATKKDSKRGASNLESLERNALSKTLAKAGMPAARAAAPGAVSVDTPQRQDTPAALSQFEQDALAKARARGGIDSESLKPSQPGTVSCGKPSPSNRVESKIGASSIDTPSMDTDTDDPVERKLRANGMGTDTTAVTKHHGTTKHDRATKHNWTPKDDGAPKFNDVRQKLDEEGDAGLEETDAMLGHTDKNDPNPQQILTPTGMITLESEPLIVGDHGLSPDAGLAIAVAVPDDEDMYILDAFQYDPETKPSVLQNKRFLTYGIGCFLLIIVAAVGGSLSVTKKLMTEPEPPLPTNAPTSQQDVELIDVLKDISGEAVTIKGTPQYKARQWIANDDALMLSPGDPSLMQRYILALIYFATGGENWRVCKNDPSSPQCKYKCYTKAHCSIDRCNAKNYYGKTTGDCNGTRFLSGGTECHWGGVICTHDGLVREIELGNNNLHGELPSEISELRYLRRLSVGFNQIVGTIPRSFGNITYMADLKLNHNGFSGSVPDEIFGLTHLQKVEFNANFLTGTLSKQWGELKSLKGLWLWNNSFTGTVPEEVGDLQFLSEFSCWQFSSVILAICKYCS